MMEKLRSQTGQWDNSESCQFSNNRKLLFSLEFEGQLGGGEWCYQGAETGAIWWDLEPRWGCLAKIRSKEAWDACGSWRWVPWEIQLLLGSTTKKGGLGCRRNIWASSFFLSLGWSNLPRSQRAADGGENSSLDTEQSRKWTEDGSESADKSLIIILIVQRSHMRQKEVKLPQRTLNGSPDLKSRQSDFYAHSLYNHYYYLLW